MYNIYTYKHTNIDKTNVQMKAAHSWYMFIIDEVRTNIYICVCVYEAGTIEYKHE